MWLGWSGKHCTHVINMEFCVPPSRIIRRKNHPGKRDLLKYHYKFIRNLIFSRLCLEVKLSILSRFYRENSQQRIVIDNPFFIYPIHPGHTQEEQQRWSARFSQATGRGRTNMDSGRGWVLRTAGRFWPAEGKRDAGSWPSAMRSSPSHRLAPHSEKIGDYSR